jgi:UDP-2,3-diacylglucosamine hydrolase
MLGDIFDFWLDYPHFMPKPHFDVLYGLRSLRDRGVQLVFVGGNHDIWCAQYFHEALGIAVLPSGSVVQHQGLRLRLDHGDGLLSGDVFYRAFRAVVRNPVAVGVAKSLHPEVLTWLAGRLSHASRQRKRHGMQRLRGAIQRYGGTHDHSDVDHLVVGHLHVPVQVQFEGWTFSCLGDWVEHHTAGRISGGVLTVGPVGEDPVETRQPRRAAERVAAR